MRSIAGLILLACVFSPSAVRATSQWSRKYGVECLTCHTAAFPRLTYWGERFMRNGYQDPGTEDGDAVGKTPVGERLFLDEVSNFLGVRLNVVPLRMVTNDVEDRPGDFKTRIDVGNSNWLQLFTAGSIFKNTSIWIETEIPFDGKVHFSWFRFGFHNLLFGPDLLNVYAGKLDPLELTSSPGRLPMIPPFSHEMYLVKSAGGAADTSVNMREGRPAVSVFGSAGPLVYQVGVDNGKNLQDVDRVKNWWGMLRYEMTKGHLQGSSISVHGVRGSDAKRILSGTTLTALARNPYYRVTPSANARWKDVDVIAAWLWGKDQNWNLTTSGPGKENVFQGAFAQAGYQLSPLFHVGAQFDRVWSNDTPSLRLAKVGLSLSWQPRQNWRLMLVPRADILGISGTHPRRNHELSFVIRSMF